MSLRIVEAMSGHILQWLEEEEIDLAILYNADDLTNYTVTRILTEDLHLVGPPDALSGAREPMRLEAVATLPLVLPSRSHGLRAFIDTVARANGIHLRVDTELDALSQIRALIARGGIFSILSLGAVHRDLAEGRLAAVPIIDPHIRRSVHLVRNPAHTLSRATVEMEKLALGLMRDLTRSGAWPARWDPQGFAV